MYIHMLSYIRVLANSVKLFEGKKTDNCTINAADGNTQTLTCNLLVLSKLGRFVEHTVGATLNINVASNTAQS